MSLLARVGEGLRKSVESVGGPMALLTNPEALKQISHNVVSALPPSPVMLGMLSRVMREMLVETLQAKKAPAKFVAACRANPAFANATETDIESFYKTLISEAIE